jgi:PAS domain S-box-containing protein
MLHRDIHEFARYLSHRLGCELTLRAAGCGLRRRIDCSFNIASFPQTKISFEIGITRAAWMVQSAFELNRFDNQRLMGRRSVGREVVVPAIAGGSVGDLLFSSGFLEALPDAAVAVDGDGVILQVNSQAQELFGYLRRELIGKQVEVLVPERLRSRHNHQRHDFAAGPRTRRMGRGSELYGRRHDGSEFPVEISLSPVAIDGGMVVLSAIRDITDRKRVEQELHRANEELAEKTAEQIGEYRARLASIIDSSEDAILAKNLDGTITAWNKGAEHIYGYACEEIVGKNISVLVPGDRPNEIPDILKKIARGEPIEHYESVRITKDGRRLSVSISISPLRDKSGAVVGASAIARDITAQRKAEEQLRQAQKMEAIGRLAGGVAHDFNNVLGIINACAEFLRDRIDPASEPSVFVENIGKATERGSALTRQLLAFSRKQAIRPVILDVNERLKDISKLLHPLMGDGVEIIISPRPHAAIVEADPGQLDQIVMNLAVNARDAMPNGGRLILETDLVELDRHFTDQHQPLVPGRYVMLAVSDSGSGMDKDTLSRIFEPFFTTKEPGKGTGLGLSTVYGIAKQSGGHVWVYSEPNHGTTFRVYLPSAEHKLTSSLSAAVEPVLPKGQGIRILLVEDDEIMRSLTRKLLEEYGFTVVEAESGTSALGWAAANPDHIDLLLTDVVMPAMSGPELAERLCVMRAGLRVVYMSGYTGELMDTGDRLKRRILLEKPFTRTALLNILHKTLESEEIASRATAASSNK